jgi:hypothetical protein
MGIEVREVATQRVIATTTRNYPDDGILTFLQQDGQDYLLISENYHGGYGCVDLATGEKVVFEPENKKDQHWCWVAVNSHDAQAKTLRISGCYWACPFDVATVDFSNPMKLPYPVISVEDEPCEDDNDDDDDELGG